MIRPLAALLLLLVAGSWLSTSCFPRKACLILTQSPGLCRLKA